jgi:hypothetical protein
MNITNLDKLISEYINKISDFPCSSCIASKYCSQVKEEEKISPQDIDCHGIIEGWLNS